jgi:pimeloyl-ACP methyl ester carboxylesterase
VATFVLVHGAWHGGWCWRDVAAELSAAGHIVLAPTSSGVAERASLAAHTDLALHVEELAGLLWFSDLRDVVLVGHSYGGMVLEPVSERCPDRVAHLGFLDGAVPLDGESEMDLLWDEERAEYEEAARTRGDGWRIPPPFPDPLPPGLPEEVVWAVSRMVAQPLATFTQPVRLTAPAGGLPPRTYLHCTEAEGEPPRPWVERVSADPDWRVVEVAAPHTGHVTAPAVVADALLGLIGR